MVLEGFYCWKWEIIIKIIISIVHQINKFRNLIKKFWTSYYIYIWLNLPKDDHNLGYIKKFLRKTIPRTQ